MRDQRRLLSWFGKDRVAGGQSGSDLAGEDCQWEVPRRDARKAPHRLTIRDARGVVAQEIHRFAQFRDTIGQGFSGLACKQSKDFSTVGFIEICSPVQNARPINRWGHPKLGHA